MKAAIIEKPGDIRVGTVDDPTPGRGELVVKVGACGICGTDLHAARFPRDTIRASRPVPALSGSVTGGARPFRPSRAPPLSGYGRPGSREDGQRATALSMD